jgi:hypothetical protein
VVGVDAGVGKAEALDGATMDEVLLNDLFGVAGFGEAVPDGVGIDDEDGAVLALVEAAGFVDADAVFEAGGFDCIFEGASELLGVFEATAGAGGFVAFVETDKEVVFEDWHRGIGCTGGGVEMRGHFGSGAGHSVRE